MITKCPNCGCQVQITKSGTSGLMTGLGMVLVVALGGFFLWRQMSLNTEHDTAAINNHIGHIGQ